MKDLFAALFFALVAAALFLLPCVSASAADVRSFPDDPSMEFLGDVDANGKVTSSDARAILRQAARLEDLDPDYAMLGDVNGDGSVKSGDARLALRMAAKLDPMVRLGQRGQAHVHDLAPATITEPKTCRICGATVGEPLSAQMKLVPEVTSLSLRQGGSAVIWIGEDFPEEAYDYDLTIRVDDDSDAIDTGWLTYLDDDTSFTKYIAIYALDTVSDAEVTVFLKQAPSVRATVRVTVSAAGRTSYGGEDPFSSVPDYGVYLGVNARYIEYTYDEDNDLEGFHFEYGYSALKSFGFSEEQLFDGFIARLKSAGFEGPEQIDTGGLYFEKGDVSVTFIYDVERDTVFVSVYSRLGGADLE